MRAACRDVRIWHKAEGRRHRLLRVRTGRCCGLAAPRRRRSDTAGKARSRTHLAVAGGITYALALEGATFPGTYPTNSLTIGKLRMICRETIPFERHGRLMAARPAAGSLPIPHRQHAATRAGDGAPH
jgi:hypothetical protein